MNYMIIKKKKNRIYEENVHKHTNTMKTSKWVNIIFGWNMKTQKSMNFLNDKLLKNQ